MEFVNVLHEVGTWRNSVKTFRVEVKDPEEFEGYMIELHPVNPRHMVDTIHKFQPLLTWTACSSFARVLLAFQYDSKYFVIFEYFEEVQRSLTLEQTQQACFEAEKGLHYIHSKASYHGEICGENIKITDTGIKIIGWALPKIRSFDPEPQIDKYKEDIISLRTTLSGITGFSIDDILIGRTLEPAKEIKPFVEETEKIKPALFFVNGKKIICADEEGNERVVAETRVAKGSCLNYFKGKLFLSGGDWSDFEFKEFCLEDNYWIERGKLITGHKYHCCIEFQEKLWIVGGIKSNKCEKFDGDGWQPGPDLFENSENPTCSVYDTLYVYSKGIQKLIGRDWIKILVCDLIAFQGINIDSTQILIFGGRTTLTYNSDILLFNQSTSSLTFQSHSTTGLYGHFSYKQLPTFLLIPSNNGKLKKFPLPPNNPNQNPL